MRQLDAEQPTFRLASPPSIGKQKANCGLPPATLRAKGFLRVKTLSSAPFKRQKIEGFPMSWDVIEQRYFGIGLKLLLGLAASSTLAQGPPPDHDVGARRRIVMLKGFGDYFANGGDGKYRLVKPEGLAVNIVAVVDHVDGERVWIRANGAGETPVGWVPKSDVILLEDSVSFFTSD